MPVLARTRDFCLEVFHLAPIGYLTVGADGRVTEANHTAGSLLGVPSNALRGEALARYAADPRTLMEHFAEVQLHGSRCAVELRLQRAAGTRFMARLESVPLADGEVLTALIDIGEQAALAAALLEREATLQSVLSTVRDAVLGIDEQGTIRAINAAGEELFGHRAAALVGKHVGLLFDTTVTPTGGAARAARGRRRDGSTFAAEVAVRHTAGASHTTVVVRDVAEREALREALTRAQRLELASHLAVGVAHDANRLLMSIVSVADGLAGSLAGLDPALGRDVDELRRATGDVSAVVRRLGALLAPDASGPTSCDVDGVIVALGAVLRAVIGERVSLELHLDARGARVRCPPAQLEQVVLNLVSNARDALLEGGTVQVVTRRLTSEVARTASGKPAGVRLTVRDSGPGIEAPLRERVFEPSFTTKPNGTGLGLPTVRSIVESAGGTVTLESEPGLGATFVIELPEDAPASASAPARARPSTLLVVEPDTLARSSLSQQLAREGHRVIEATSAGDAIDRLRAHSGRVDALIAPLARGGPELAEHVRAERPDVAVLFTSPDPQHALVHAGLLGAGVALLSSPYSTRDLARALAQLLETDRPRGAPSVLVVEDDELNRRMLGKLLDVRGYEVRLAPSIAAAVDLQRAAPADVVLGDAHLPDGNIGDLLRALRAEGPERPVVILSGLGPSHDPFIAAALETPRTSFVAKPAAIDQITAELDRILG